MRAIKFNLTSDQVKAVAQEVIDLTTYLIQIAFRIAMAGPYGDGIAAAASGVPGAKMKIAALAPLPHPKKLTTIADSTRELDDRPRAT